MLGNPSLSCFKAIFIACTNLFADEWTVGKCKMNKHGDTAAGNIGRHQDETLLRFHFSVLRMEFSSILCKMKA